MPDIAMCVNHACPKIETCFRYTATPSMMQAYAEFKYENGCDSYIDVRSKSQIKRLKEGAK